MERLDEVGAFVGLEDLGEGFETLGMGGEGFFDQTTAMGGEGDEGDASVVKLASRITSFLRSSRSTAVLIEPLVRRILRPMVLTGRGPWWSRISRTTKSDNLQPMASKSSLSQTQFRLCGLYCA
jgi:hypothetical protein